MLSKKSKLNNDIVINKILKKKIVFKNVVLLDVLKLCKISI